VLVVREARECPSDTFGAEREADRGVHA
jgi:hypothetical protein